MKLRKVNAETFNNGASNSGACGLGTIINGLIDAANMAGGDKNTIEISSSDSAADILKTLKSAEAGDRIVIKASSDDIEIPTEEDIFIADGVHIDGGGKYIAFRSDSTLVNITFGKGCVVKNIVIDLDSRPDGQTIKIGDGSVFENVCFPNTYYGVRAVGCTLINVRVGSSFDGFHDEDTIHIGCSAVVAGGGGNTGFAGSGNTYIGCDLTDESGDSSAGFYLHTLSFGSKTINNFAPPNLSLFKKFNTGAVYLDGERDSNP